MAFFTLRIRRRGVPVKLEDLRVDGILVPTRGATKMPIDM